MRAIFKGAVILINYNGILGIHHIDMLENNVPSKPIARPWPRLNPQPNSEYR